MGVAALTPQTLRSCVTHRQLEHVAGRRTVFVHAPFPRSTARGRGAGRGSGFSPCGWPASLLGLRDPTRTDHQDRKDQARAKAPGQSMSVAPTWPKEKVVGLGRWGHGGCPRQMGGGISFAGAEIGCSIREQANGWKESFQSHPRVQGNIWGLT